MLTPFGKQLRKYRIEKGVKIKDIAEKLGHTSSYVSALEMGKKNVLSSFLESVSRILELNSDEQNMLASLAEQQKKSFKIKAENPEEATLAASFARHLPKLSRQQMEEIKTILEKSK